MAKWLALDIGGANLKLANGEGFAVSYAFPLWKQSAQLANELRMLIAEAPPTDHLAVTMTGELADCFENKAEGVRFILEALNAAADSRHTRVYLNDGRLVTLQVALTRPLDAAAANWHALAAYIGRTMNYESMLLVDIGSTTCDLVPIRDGQVAARGANDTDRLMAGELVYTGAQRTPLCALIQSAPFRNQDCPVAAELFATTLDVYVLLGQIPESRTNTNTADGRPAIKSACRNRMKRMLAAEDFNHRDAVGIAQAVAVAQQEKIVAAAKQVLDAMDVKPRLVVLSGEGEFIGRKVFKKLGLNAHMVEISSKFGVNCSRCATAHALAAMAADEGVR